ncbi:helix-turn-helix transcriptional regulator [Microbacterium sp. K24]|uniref:helix-turn-helix domain-containing protein n=1 Tax=Microbacterium sp. K24 TaxID=2305446 RepID=UPI00109D3D0B|nr:helix-turn-helix transcriptional regulator [Microbacterium sp. K24]
MTESDLAAKWGEWLREQLAERGWRQADLVRESEGLIKRDRASKWVNGNERPSHRLAIVAANTLGITRERALFAAGYAASLDDLTLDSEANAAVHEERMQKLRTMDANNLSHVPSSVLLAEIARRLNAVAPGDDEDAESDVSASGHTRDQYARAARLKSRDRGEDLV